VELISRKVGDKPVVIAPLGDVQWAGEENELWMTGLRRYIARAIDAEAWFIGMGDYIDFASPSNRKGLDTAHKYDSAERVLDSAALRLVDQVYEILKPTKGRWLAMLEGHHFWELKTGGTTDTKLCEMLDAPFAGKSCIAQLRFSGPSRGGTYNIWATHGEGGASESSLLLRIKRQSQYWEGINLFLWGHATKKLAVPIPRIRPNFTAKIPRLEHRDAMLVGTGGWMKGFVEGHQHKGRAAGTYVEEKMMDPVSLGAPLITVIPRVSAARDAAYGKKTSGEGNRSRSQWDPQTEVSV
jgi:hypothetical protein